ncbi:MAG: recombination mediator RecR [Alphaproteobacteria bacterium]
MVTTDIDRLIHLLAKLPGLGPRSARRAALFLLKRRESLMQPLAQALAGAAESVRNCAVCGNLDTVDPCSVCRDSERDKSLVCVVQEVGDLWAIERTASYKGLYHVVGGTLSALDGIRPEDLNLASLRGRVGAGEIREVILALGATVDGQTTAHYIADHLGETGVQITRLARGLPVGGELDYMDDGTLQLALRTRNPV